MLNTYEQHSKRKLAATVVAIVIIAGLVVLTDHLKAKSSSAASTIAQNSTSDTTTSSTDTSNSSTATTTPATPTTSSGYKDGSYNASSSYYVPHGNESIQVRLTLSNGVVTNVSIQNSENDNDSARFQENFAATYKTYVVGKKISGLQVGAIAGASDTAQGFNDAISQIASKAQA